MLARRYCPGKQLIDMAFGRRLGIVRDPADQLIADDMKNQGVVLLALRLFLWDVSHREPE
jgi:hypothetical protein